MSVSKALWPLASVRALDAPSAIAVGAKATSMVGGLADGALSRSLLASSWRSPPCSVFVDGADRQAEVCGGAEPPALPDFGLETATVETDGASGWVRADAAPRG